jgi:hypothetical protein
MSLRVHASLACWPGKHPVEAAALAHLGPTEEPWGVLSADHLQLVPQSSGLLSEGLVDGLMAAFPSTCFRLHANVRVLPTHRLADLSSFDEHTDWFERAAQLHKRLKSTACSLHAGRRQNATLQQVFDNAHRAADFFGTPVAVEGLYPDSKDTWLLSTWAEYESLLQSRVPYAIDLSHLHILANRNKHLESGLVKDLLSNDRCLEVHVSDNDGFWDGHEKIRDRFDPLWWMPLVEHIHPDALVFTEGIQSKPGPTVTN